MLLSAGWYYSPSFEGTEAQLKLLAQGSVEMRTQVSPKTLCLLVSGTSNG